MTDYLAAVLGEDQEELAGLLPRGTVFTGKKAPAPETEEAGGEAGAEPRRLLEAEEESGAWMAEETEGKTPVLAALDQAEGTAERALFWPGSGERREDGGVLYQSLRRAARVARLAEGGREKVTVALPGETGEAAALDWAGLDRAVERDARRYDGGFPLY